MEKGKLEDLVDSEHNAVYTREDSPELNHEVELAVHANTFTNPLFPKPGMLAVGENGLEYRADSGRGYIQIPWASIEGVEVDIPAGNYVRSIKVATSETRPLEFVVSDGKNLVRALNRHLGREKLSMAPQNVQSALRTAKNKIRNFFKKNKDKQA